MALQALRLHAGPAARRHIAQNGLQPADIGVVAGAAGGPKGLILGPLDRFVFGQWLARSAQPVDLVGASIGAWRMATACLPDAVAAFERLEHDYIRQHYALQPGEKRPPAERVSALFAQNLQAFFGGQEAKVLTHPRYRLHIVTSHGRHVLRREDAWRTPLGYLGAFLSNAVHRRALGVWLERVVFSTAGAPLPFVSDDFPTRQFGLTPTNFQAVLQASCAIPFVLRAVHDIPGAPPGAYWDGGITDYHLHLNYAQAAKGLVLYPHFQQAVVPGWLDKGLRWRHGATPKLDTMLLLAPDPAWVQTLPRGKLPDRTDFTHFGADLPGRVQAWSRAVAESARLADEFQAWLDRPDPAALLPL
ncbi:MAG: hypothetical protein RIS90_2544 [Pseudomonadota bacterium]